VVIRRFDTKNPQDNHEKHVPLGELDHLLKHRLRVLSAEGRRLAAIVFADREPTQNVDHSTFLPDQIFDGVDPDRPVVAVFLHCFTDAPHYAAHNLYDDYYQWLRDTLEFALHDSSKTWLIKGHPHAFHYKEKKNVNELFTEMVQGIDHVRLVPERVTIAQLAPHLSAVVANAGTVCVEGPMLGVPTISASVGIWSGYGFDHVASSLEQYYDLLGRAGTLPAVTDHERDLAFALYALVKNELSVTSAILPEITHVFWEPIDTEKIFDHCVHQLSTLNYRHDPFYRALAEGLETGRSILLPHESTGVSQLEEVCHGSASSAPGRLHTG
jgi:hypothetical protein